MTQLIIERYQRKGLHFIDDLGNGVQLEMVLIKGGTFLMGTEDKEIERLVKKFEDDCFRPEAPQHQVTVPNFFMGKYQVTQKQWKAVAALPGVERELELEPSHFKGDDLPVEQVTWYDAVEFCARLSNHTGRRYSLPSEAEWEYACRAGTNTPFHFGETITGDLANYPADKTYTNEPKRKHRKKTTTVGEFPSNAFGLYDMHGNVWDWCLDDWHSSYSGAPTDGSAWFYGGNSKLSQKQGGAIVRGGSWFDIPQVCRSAYRKYPHARNDKRDIIGFRVVCAVGRT